MLGSLEKLKKDDIIIDVAASNSPFKEILIKKGFDNTFRTDLNFTTNLERNEIGSSADDLSFFSDSSVSLIVSHNSVEHFEGDADIGFLKEAARVLKPNSAVVWIPLVMAKGGVNHTDPSVWATKYRNAPSYPVFDKRFPVQFGTHKQRLMKFFDPKVLDEDLGKIKELKFDVVELENGKRGNKFALVGTKN